MRINITENNHVCFFGRTRSGKTTLAKHLLSRVRQYVVLDPKHTYTDPYAEISDAFDAKTPRQIIRVPFDNEMERWDDVIHRVWEAGNRVLYVDEATLITPARTILPSLGRAIRTGIERGVGVWTGSQRPKDIPSVVYTETEHFFVFQLIWKDDRDKVMSFTGDRMSKLLPKVRNHDCVYYNVWEDKIAYLRPTIVA